LAGRRGVDQDREVGRLRLERVRDGSSADLYVIHARDEVHALADRVVVLERGRVVRSGKPSE
jgi:ABC-type molybdate transport system ATPase subunit